MNVVIPPEFERFAREQVEAGHVASEEEAVASALRDYLAQIKELRALMKPAMDESNRGEDVDGETVLNELIEDTRRRFGG